VAERTTLNRDASKASTTHSVFERELLFGRFEVIEQLGQGGFGRVVRALDRETRAEVAFKLLHRFDADALLSFKHEFRTLVGVQHPNLVRLGELFEHGGRWGFSMELLTGSDFLGWLRERRGPDLLDEGRLRSGIVQLAQGLLTLHALGLLHRDVKPENVRVTVGGRVVLLDFGLVTHLSDRRHASDSTSPATIEYMAPEQASNDGLGPAADWYALGVLLYEALTGRLPFEGANFQILLDKQQRDPEPPSARCAGIPPYLDRLCLALLERDPAQRATGAQVLAALGRSISSLPPVSVAFEAGRELFVGRLAELSDLEASFARARSGRALMVAVEGESGVGKSGLVRRFAEASEHNLPNLLVLSGRCHAAEQVPFKMFDGIVDELVRYLASLSESECQRVVGEHAGLLPMLFPVMAHVPVVNQAAAARRYARSSDAPTPRYVLFAAMADLLGRIAEQRPLLIIIDDLQWGDEESIQLMRALLDAERPLAALIIGTVHPLDNLEGALGQALRALTAHAEVRRLAVSELAASDARMLSAHWLGVDRDDPRAEELARETAGHPLFITELAGRTSSQFPERAQSLDDALRARAVRLGRLPRRLLELLAVASAPLPLALAGEALGVQGETLARAAAELRHARLVRSVRRGELTCYHDRVRSALLAGMSAATIAALHEALAQSFADDFDIDPARVAAHWIAAGAAERALPRLEQAAERATKTLAFERAAELYRDMLASCERSLDHEQVHRLKLARANALASAGRSAESARVLLEALDAASPTERRELSVRAAQQLLQAAQIEEGLTVARRAMEEVGLVWPKTSTYVLLRLLWQRMMLAARGTTSELRRDEDVPEDVRVQLDMLWRLWLPLIWADLLRNAELGARHLQLALGKGPARHVSFALHAEAILSALREAGSERAEDLLRAAEPFVACSSLPEVRAYDDFARGTVAFLCWRVRDGAELFSCAERRYREECPGDAWMLANVRGSHLTAIFSIGEHARHAELSMHFMQEAEARGDSFARATYGVLGFGFLRLLMRDDVSGARDLIERAMAPWQVGLFGVQHLAETVALHCLVGYEGGTRAHEYWERVWPAIRGSFLAKTAYARDLLRLFRADAAVRAASVLSGEERSARLRDVHARLHELRHSAFGFVLAWRPFIQAQAALLEDDRTSARRCAEAAAASFQGAGHFTERHCRLLIAFIDGRDAFDKKRDELLEWHRSEGWQKPERAAGNWLAIYDWLDQHAIGEA
jgi:tetratricopeptide (TPR) repeat protein